MIVSTRIWNIMETLTTVSLRQAISNELDKSFFIDLVTRLIDEFRGIGMLYIDFH